MQRVFYSPVWLIIMYIKIKSVLDAIITRLIYFSVIVESDYFQLGLLLELKMTKNDIKVCAANGSPLVQNIW